MKFPDGFEVPQTTPQPERLRLVSKGKFLTAHCLDDGHTDCVLGFVEHCLGKSPPQLDVVMDVWRALRQEYEQLLGTTDGAQASRAGLLQELLQDVMSRLAKAAKALTPL
jgi:hypothetical protein